MDYQRALGAEGSAGTLLLVMFVPSRTRSGRVIDHDYWVTEALATLGRLFGGATAFPRGRGVWRDDGQGGRLVFEEPTIVHCYADPRAATDDAVSALRVFLHRLGRETDQGEVGLVISGAYIRIRTFESEARRHQ